MRAAGRLTRAWALALAVGLPARALACVFCAGSPPALPPAPPTAPAAPAAPAPAAPEPPLDLRRISGFAPLEQAFLRSAGRYQPRSVYLEDTQAADPERHLLRPAQVEGLLRDYGAAFVRHLRNRGPETPPSEGERAEAFRLLWNRGSYLAPADREYLASLTATRYGKVPKGRERTPAVAADSGGAASPGSGWSPAPLDAEARQLLGQLRSKLTLSFSGDQAQQARERAALETTLEHLMRSPTSRELARQFVAQNGSASVQFGDMEGSALVSERGRSRFTGVRGYTSAEGGKISVVLNRHFLSTDPDQRDMASTLAHELLGHGFRQILATRVGAGAAYLRYRDNETNAGVLGWIVGGELGLPMDNNHMWSYLRSPPEYHQALQQAHPYYATTFSREEMADPVPELRRRLERARAARAALPQTTQSWRSWLPIIRHFVDHADHRLPEPRFQYLLDDIRNITDVYVPKMESDLREVESAVERLIVHYGSEAGRAELQQLQAAASNAFFTDAERELTRVTRRLQEVTRGRTAAGEAPPLPPIAVPGGGQQVPYRAISWDDLRRMTEEDRRDRPAHWSRAK